MTVTIIGALDGSEWRAESVPTRHARSGSDFVIVTFDEAPDDDQLPSRRKVEEGRARHVGLGLIGELRDWLDVSLDEAAQMVGISVSTIFNWARDLNVSPRPSTLRKLIRAHALIGFLVDRRGEDHVKSWYWTGDPSPASLLAGGDEGLETLEQSVYRSVQANSSDRLRSLLAGHHSGPAAGRVDLHDKD